VAGSERERQADGRARKKTETGGRGERRGGERDHPRFVPETSQREREREREREGGREAGREREREGPNIIAAHRHDRGGIAKLSTSSF